MVKNNIARVTQLGPQNFRSAGNMGLPLAIVVLDGAKESQSPVSNALLEEMKKISRSRVDLVEQFTFCFIDGKKWGAFLQQFKIDGSSLPEVFVLNFPKKLYWKNTRSGTEEQGTLYLSIADFLIAVSEGKVKEHRQETRNNRSFQNPLKDMKEVFDKLYPWSLAILIPIIAICGLILMACFGSDMYDEPMSEQLKVETKKDK
uniref:Thioredoxin domain-containing protein n=2 Tax=Corethron hystrix TaxID=216773 RepID=A0A7S1FZL4_9STRA|mmetsp:Transcript_42879/g.100659  ORF Transcript_42879/g.100659 Transcript_42879/m.100659 type:complete len:203 (+) Transcript_42879:1092-1700(+)